jgi:hypothetical protein
MWREFYDPIADELSGHRALAQAGEQNRLERFFTFPNFERSAERCAAELQNAGLTDVEVEDFPADGRSSWFGWGAMKAWDVDSARLVMVAPRHVVLADWAVKPQVLVMYSGPCRVEADLVEWNGEPDADLTGKIPLTRHRPIDLVPEVRARKLPGLVSDFLGTLPGIRDAFDLPDDVRWENYAFKSCPGDHWGFMVSPRQGQMLRDLLRQGPVRLRAEIRARVYDGTMKSATGIIQGTDLADEEVLFTSHLYEPGANDNASGVGLGLEIARSLNFAVTNGTIPRPRRSIRFLFSWEGFGLLAWIHKHHGRTSRLIGGVNIDEIGVDQTLGRSVLHLFMPPAANDSAVACLAAHLCEQILSPGIRWRTVADRAEIINDAIVSDPSIGIAMPTLIQYPARHYHASSDTMPTLSPETMAAIGRLCAVQLYVLSKADADDLRFLGRLVVASCQEKLNRTELRLLDHSWPFGQDRTLRWYRELFATSLGSLQRLGVSDSERSALSAEVRGFLEEWARRLRDWFPAEHLRRATLADIERAAATVLERALPGIAMPHEIKLEPREARRFYDILYGNNLDLVFLRLAYWANGTRSLLDIVERLEIELDELYRDTSIARTTSGAALLKEETVEIDLAAIIAVSDVIVASGLLRRR